MRHEGHEGHGQAAAAATGEDTASAVLHVGGLHYASEKAVVERALGSPAGTLAVETNPVSQTATVEYDPARTSVEGLVRWVEKCGYQCAGRSVSGHVCDPLAQKEPLAPAHDHAAVERSDEAHGHRRTNLKNLRERGYEEEGTTTTPFGMVMLDDLDRFHPAIDVVDRVPGLAARAGHLRPGSRGAARPPRSAARRRFRPRLPCDDPGRGRSLRPFAPLARGVGIRRYGFRDGRSVDTTMGFSPLEGVPMTTRSGPVDPGALLYLLRDRGLDAGPLEHALNDESGLEALAGHGGGMREIEAAARAGDASAALAPDVFVHRVAGSVAAMAAAAGGIDALVFTAGIGEGSELVRERVAKRLRFLASSSTRPGTERPSTTPTSPRAARACACSSSAPARSSSPPAPPEPFSGRRDEKRASIGS